MMLVAKGETGPDKTLNNLRVAIFGPQIVSELNYVSFLWLISPQANSK